MRMKLFDRILLTIYTLVIIFISLFSFAIAWGVIPRTNVVYWVERIYGEWLMAIIVTVIGLLFLVVSLKLLLSGTKKAKPRSTLLKNTEFGGIRISLSTIDGLAQKAVRSFTGVRDVKSEILSVPEGVRILLRIGLMADVNIPDLTVQLQNGVKEYVEKHSGIYVKDIQVYVDNPLQNS